MSAACALWLYTPAGLKVAHIDDALEIGCSRRINEPGVGAFALRGTSSKIGMIQYQSQVAIRRRHLTWGIPWYEEFRGFVVKKGFRQPDRKVFEVELMGMMGMLGFRVNAWKDKVTNRTVFTSTSIETIIKTIVTYNCTASATTGAGRLVNGAINTPWTLTVEADGNRGYVMDRANQGAGILKEIQDLIEIAKANGNGGDIELQQTGPATFQLNWKPGQVGADRRTGTGAVLFAMERGNMTEPVYSEDRSGERTVAIVAGQGDDPNRAYAIRTGPTYSASNQKEVWISGVNEPGAGALNARGDQELYKLRGATSLTYKVRQTKGCCYGKHYFLGDRVRGSFHGVTVDQQVVGSSLSWEKDGTPEIGITLLTF